MGGCFSSQIVIRFPTMKEKEGIDLDRYAETVLNLIIASQDMQTDDLVPNLPKGKITVKGNYDVARICQSLDNANIVYQI